MNISLIKSCTLPRTLSPQKEDLNQFIIHSALDMVDQRVWTGNSMFLKEVDKFNDLSISAFCTAGHVRFMLLHDARTDENAVKTFLYEIYELYIKVLLNPFQEKTGLIKSAAFDARVRASAKRHFAAH